MTELVLEHRSSLYFRRQKKQSCWHLKVRNAQVGFEFPPWVEIKDLWRRVAPDGSELMCRGDSSGHLVFSVQTRVMSRVKKSFMAGMNQLIKEKEQVDVL